MKARRFPKYARVIDTFLHGVNRDAHGERLQTPKIKHTLGVFADSVYMQLLPFAHYPQPSWSEVDRTVPGIFSQVHMLS